MVKLLFATILSAAWMPTASAIPFIHPAARADTSFEAQRVVLGGREVGTADLYWRSVVGVEFAGGGTCSGVLITRKSILTAAHCFDAALPVDKIVFFNASGDGKAFSRPSIKVRLNTGYQYSVEKKAIQDTPDLAVISFSGPLPNGYEPVEFALQGPYSELHFVGVGSSIGGDYGVLRHGTIRFRGGEAVSDNTVGSCPGDSGGAVLVEDRGKLRLFGIIQGGPRECVEGTTPSWMLVFVAPWREWIGTTAVALEGRLIDAEEKASAIFRSFQDQK